MYHLPRRVAAIERFAAARTHLRLAGGAPGKPDAGAQGARHGADVNARDPKGRTVLMMLAISQSVTPDLMQAIIDRGADVHAKSIQGLNALDYALRLGRQPIIDVLTRAGVQPTNARRRRHPDSSPTTRCARRSRAACRCCRPAARSSTSAAAALAVITTCRPPSRSGRRDAPDFAVDESLAREELSTLVRDIDATREQALEGMVVPGGLATTTGYILLALDEQKYPADESTDALVRLLRLMQRADGRWPTPFRPPIEASEFTATAVARAACEPYGGDNPAANSAALLRAPRWLETAQPLDHEDRVFRLLGLVWVDGSKAVREAALRELLETQRKDGGWAQTEYRSSDAYATGEALFALRAAGVAADSRVYRRGVRYLLKTQLADGSWLVRTRAHPTQNYFESGFPHGADQFISAAATNWATQALLLSLPDAKPPAAQLAMRPADRPRADRR